MWQIPPKQQFLPATKLQRYEQSMVESYRKWTCKWLYFRYRRENMRGTVKLNNYVILSARIVCTNSCFLPWRKINWKNESKLVINAEDVHIPQRQQKNITWLLLRFKVSFKFIYIVHQDAECCKEWSLKIDFKFKKNRPTTNSQFFENVKRKI